MASIDEVKIFIEYAFDVEDDGSDSYILNSGKTDVPYPFAMVRFHRTNFLIDAPFARSESVTAEEALEIAESLIYGVAVSGDWYSLRHVMALENASPDDIWDAIQVLLALSHSLQE